MQANILPLEILANLSASILVTCSSHSFLLLFIHSFIGWIVWFSAFLLYLFLFCELFSLVLSYHLFPIFVWFFYVSTHVSSAYAIIGRTVMYVCVSVCLLAFIYSWTILIRSLGYARVRNSYSGVISFANTKFVCNSTLITSRGINSPGMQTVNNTQTPHWVAPLTIRPGRV